MAEHLRHRLAREGHVVRPDSILTLSRFVEPFVRDVPQASRARLDRMVARLLEESPPGPFAGLRRSRGLRRTVVSLIEESASAGATPERIAEVADTPAAKAFHEVYAAIARDSLLRAERLRMAAARIAEAKPAFRSFYLDGFYSFTPAELEIIRAMGPAVVRLPEWSGSVETRAALERAGFRWVRMEEDRGEPEAVILRPATQQQEAEEIARRIVDLVAEGRNFRDIGVLMRNEHPYAALLQTTFTRFGIPASFYFQQTLDVQPVIRFYSALLDAVERGWDYEALLRAAAARRSGFGGTALGDKLAFELKSKLPAVGLPVELDRWRALADWRHARHAPRDWAVRLRELRTMVQLPGITDGVSHEQAFEWRALARSMDEWDAALDETASLVEDRAHTLTQFREHLAEVLNSAPFDRPEQRRNVVHVMDVYEARQWRLPVVFLCGLVERGFPQYHSEHPLLNDAQRMKLREAGVVLRSSVERQREEEFLFDVAVTRAYEELFLSYPATNAKGEETLPSFLAERYRRRNGTRVAPVLASRPVPLFPKPAPQDPKIADAGLLKWMRKNPPALSPTAIETYLQCPFQYFGRQNLKLAAPPEAPADRLDFLLQGDILHRTLAEAHGAPMFVDEIFTRLFADICRANAVPESARTEKIRLELIANLQRFLESTPLTGGSVVAVEKPFELALQPGLKLRGKIDRVMEVPQRGLVVIDFKYSTRERIRERVKSHARGELVQGGLYLWASEKLFRQPAAGMLYCGLRGEVAWGGWHLPMFNWDEIGETFDAEALKTMIATAVDATQAVAGRIASGEIAPDPADDKKCVWCEFRDVCRVEA